MHLTNYKSVALSAFLAAAFLLMGTVVFADSYGSGSYSSNEEDSGRNIDIQLSGSQEVPSVSTNTTGQYELDFDDNGANMVSRLEVYNGDEITAAHLHCAPPGENGPPVVTLFSDSNGTDVNDLLDSSSINDSDIADVNCASEIGYDIENVQDLARAINDGEIYVNVHSQSHPDGLIRGNLPAGEDNSSDDDYNNSSDDHGYGGHGNNDGHDWKDDDHGKHDWNHKDWDQWNKDHGEDWNEHNDWNGGKGGHSDWNRDHHEDDWKDGNNDWNNRNGKDGKDGHDGKDGKDGRDGNDWHSIRTGDAHASAKVFNLVNATSRIRIH